MIDSNTLFSLQGLLERGVPTFGDRYLYNSASGFHRQRDKITEPAEAEGV